MFQRVVVLTAAALVAVSAAGCSGASPTPIIVYVTPAPTASPVAALSPEPTPLAPTPTVTPVTPAPSPTPVPTPTPEPTPTPKPKPTPKPTPSPKPYHELSAELTSYTPTTSVGGYIDVVFTITNSGTAESPDLTFQFFDVRSHADLVGCDPKCTSPDFAREYIVLNFSGGVGPGVTATYTVRFLATAVGVVNWRVTTYDKDGDWMQDFSGTTEIH